MLRRLRVIIVFVVLGLGVLTAVTFVSVRPPLSDAHHVVEQRWSELRPKLDARYATLHQLADAVHGVRSDFGLLPDVTHALDGWERVHGAGIDTAPAAANRVEGIGARLAVAITASASLEGDPGVAKALEAYIGSDPDVALGAYDKAVERYDHARSRFPGRFFSSLLGFDAVRTVEVPPVLAGIKVPAPAPATSTTTTSTAPTSG